MDISNHPWHLYLMSAIYIIAGLFHFIAPTKYREIVPRYIPYRNSMVFWSGIAEIIIGIGVLIPVFQKAALMALILMLLIFFTVHFYMLKNTKRIPKWILMLRIPLQFVLIYWAFSYLQH